MKIRLGIIIVLLIASMILCGCIDAPRMETQYVSGTPIPVEFIERNNPDGYSGKYHVATAVLSGDSSEYKLVPKDLPYSQSLVLKIVGLDSVWTAPLRDPPNPKYYYHTYMGPWWLPYEALKYDTVPFYVVDGFNSKIITNSDATLLAPDGSKKSTHITNSNEEAYVKTYVVKDTDGISRTIYLKYQSVVLKSGDLPPSGDMVVIQKPFLGYQLSTADNLDGGIAAWNSYVREEFHDSWEWSNIHIDSWNDCYNWMSAEGRIPEPAISASTGYEVTTNTDTDTDGKIDIRYPSTVFALQVTFYVPEELAEYVVIVESEPEFDIDPIDDISGIEAGSYRLTVSGTALGTGTVRMGAGGTAIRTAVWIDGSEKQIVKGEDYVFEVDLEFKTGLDADKEFDAYIFAQPSGLGKYHREDFKVYLADKDTVPASEKHSIRVYGIYDTTGEKVMAAPLYIGYGSDRNIGYGDSTKTSMIEGTYQVYSENITGWYPAYTAEHPKTINVEDDTKVEILFTTNEPEYEDDDGIFSMDLWLPIVGILIIVGYVVMMYGGGVRILEPLRPILSNPYFWMFMAALVVCVVGWLIYKDMSAKADDFTDAIAGIKLI